MRAELSWTDALIQEAGESSLPLLPHGNHSEKTDMMAPWSWTSSLPNCEKQFLLFISRSVCGVLLRSTDGLRYQGDWTAWKENNLRRLATVRFPSCNIFKMANYRDGEQQWLSWVMGRRRWIWLPKGSTRNLFDGTVLSLDCDGGRTNLHVIKLNRTKTCARTHTQMNACKPLWNLNKG